MVKPDSVFQERVTFSKFRSRWTKISGTVSMRGYDTGKIRLVFQGVEKNTGKGYKPFTEVPSKRKPMTTERREEVSLYDRFDRIGV